MDMENEEDMPDWNDLTNKDKLKLFSTWSIVTIISNIFLITGSLFLIINTKTVTANGEFFLGLGSMLTWFSLMKYYQNTKGFNIIANTLENSFEIVIKALTGIMPIFIGFGMLGTCIFWRSHRFNDLSTSMFTLFAVMNGDMIWDAWHDIDTINFLLAQLFLYSFILFSICVVFNVFIVIIEDGYIMQKFFARTDWVRGVNQRSSLHTTEFLMRDKMQSGNDINKEGPTRGDYGTHQQLHKMSVNEMSDSEHKSGKLNIPMLHGAPIPHDGDPFIRIIKKTKKDVRSRKALVKMLRHEKLEILDARHRIKIEAL